MLNRTCVATVRSLRVVASAVLTIVLAPRYGAIAHCKAQPGRSADSEAQVGISFPHAPRLAPFRPRRDPRPPRTDATFRPE
jgi:hypothetical protein